MTPREVRLLLVDDDPASLRVMGRMLSQYPDRRFATSGEDALRLAREATPDLIVLDVDMPGMTGLDVCEALNADPVLADVPIIFATSHEPTTLLQMAAFQRGASDFITKPLIAAQLTARVRAHLRAKLVIDEARRDSLATGASPSRPSTNRPRLLIVDDDMASVQVLRHALAEMGDFHFARNGKEALELAHRLAPDLILLDARMPGLDGFYVCKTLKADNAFRHVPIAFITRFSDLRSEMRALDLGAADFIAKPYARSILQARVRNLLELKRRVDAELQSVREHWSRVADARLADIVGAASDAIVTCDADDRVVLINAAACRMFGVEHARAMGLPIRALLGEGAPTGTHRQVAPVRTTITRANGERFATEMSVSRLGEASDCLTTVMLRDISDRERLEAETRSRIQAESASMTKTLLLAYVAHEMGNPLNGMMGFAQLMAADDDHPLPAAQAKRLAQVMASGKHLEGLMRDLMDLGSLETGKLEVELEALEAAHCAQDAIDAVEAMADQAGVTLACLRPSSDAYCAADAKRLHQCLVNLLTNAIKYTRRGGWARIEVTGDSQKVEIAVRDNGLGLDEMQCQHLFEPFNRLGRQRGAAPGAGLGLAITRQLVEAMNGHLRVESEPGLGSCFTIALPGTRAPSRENIDLATCTDPEASDAPSNATGDQP